MPGAHFLGIDRIACDGYGLCAELLPEIVELDEWGYPVVGSAPLTGEAPRHARRAVAACPALALRLDPAPGRGPDRQPDQRS
ncbi:MULTISPECIES: ferredoxin [unclassified Streptomyces]|uniref:ferredoxin n=1 Tax=unclassified Streptomyces TaxID=2593676 RepID=UPI0034363BD3